MVNIGETFILNKVKFFCRSGGTGRAPGVFKIYGTNYINLFYNKIFNSGWTPILDNTTKSTQYKYEEAKEVLISGNNNAFSIYILVVNQLSGTKGNHFVLNFLEWELYGYTVKVIADEIDIQNTSNHILNTSNILNERINNLPLSLWVDNTSYLSYGGVNVYNDKITIGNGTILTKYPRENMTSATKTYTDGTIVRATETSCYNNRHAWTLFDGSKYTNDEQYTSLIKYNTTGDISLINTAPSSQYFNNDTNYYGEYLILDLGEKIVLNNYIIYFRNGGSRRAPKNWRMYATNDDASYNNTKSGKWVNIDEQSGISEYTNSVSKTFTLSPLPIVSYRYYAFIVNGIQSNGDGYLQFTELEFYGFGHKITKYF